MFTSAEGYCDFGGGWIILFESDSDAGGESGSVPSCNYTLEVVLQLRKITKKSVNLAI
jgi:hypothetical protein